MTNFLKIDIIQLCHPTAPELKIVQTETGKQGMRKLNQKTVWSTDNLYLAAAIICFTGIEPVLEIQGNWVQFIFPINSKLHEALQKFNGGEAYSLSEFSRQVKRLRALMLTMRRNRITSGEICR